MQALDQFRLGGYAGADDNVKDAWFMFLDRYLITDKVWKKKRTRRKRLLSDIVTTSDEALAMWLIKINWKKWEKEINGKDYPEGQDTEEQDEGSGNETADKTNKRKRGKKAGQHSSTKFMKKYLRFYEHVNKQ